MKITCICFLMIGVAVVAANPITTPAYSEMNAENNPVYEDAVAEARADTPYRAEEKKGPVYKPTPVYKKPAVYEVKNAPVYTTKPEPSPAPVAYAKQNAPAYNKPVYEEPKPYSFAYDVNDEYYYDNHGRQEKSDGKTTSGSYHVVLPDGRRQVVTYTVDPYGGYVADVKYEAGYPAYVAPKQSYKPAAAYQEPLSY